MKISAFRNPKSIAALALIALASLIMTLTLLADAPSASAQAQPLATSTPAPQTDPIIPLPDSKKPPLGNLDSMLSQLVESVEQGISTANDAAASAPISSGESVAVTFYTQGDATSLADFLRSNGGDPRNVGEGYIEAYVPISLLVTASEQPGVIRVDAIVPPQPAGGAAPLSPDSLDTQNAPASRGNVTSQGVAVHGADVWHRAGYTGRGVKVGIIDLGFRGFRARMGNELPANVTARCYRSTGVFSASIADCETGSSYGTASAETMMDIAPDVTLYISNPYSWGDLKNTVAWMVSQDVDVINHSVGYLWDGPGNGTSPNANSPLKSVDAAVSGGAVWSDAAGNDARRTWYGQFTDSDGDNRLNFVGGDELNEIEIAAGERVTIQLRWDDSWTGADTDLDLLLYNANNPSNLVSVASSVDYQTGLSGHRPFEWISYTPTTSGTYGIAVRHYSGATPRWVQLQSWSRSTIRHYSVSGSIGNPTESANPGMLAVAAANYWDTNTIAWYSSRGPAPDGRNKPDITGATCAQVASTQATTLSSGQRCWFSGTGMSSPQVAGLAALVKDAFPNYTPQQIANYLKTNAQARGAKPNNTWGHGFARLPAPPQTAVTPSPTPIRPLPTPVTGSGDLASRVAAIERQTGEMRNQMGALQRLVENLQSLIQALTNRVTALEQSSNAPVAKPTATATPTPRPRATQTPTATPSPMPITRNTCVQPITPGRSIRGTWTSRCLAANPVSNYSSLPRHSGTYYAKFYTFTLSRTNHSMYATITLSSSSPTFIHLLSGSGTDGDVVGRTVYEDRDRTTNTLTVNLGNLRQGSYTIEAASSRPRVIDEFQIYLTLGEAPTPTPTPTPPAVIYNECLQPIEPLWAGEPWERIRGTWTTSCLAANPLSNYSSLPRHSGTYYAKFYTFTLDTRMSVTITLSSSFGGAFIHLLSGAGTDGAVVDRTVYTHRNPNSLTTTVQPGSYTIEATGSGPRVTGDFNLSLRIRPVFR